MLLTELIARWLTLKFVAARRELLGEVRSIIQGLAINQQERIPLVEILVGAIARVPVDLAYTRRSGQIR